MSFTTIILYLVGALVLLVGLRILYMIGKALFALWMLKKGATVFLEDVGKQAMDKQKDEIHLVPFNGDTWRKPERAQELFDGVLALGFRDAGAYSVTEMAGLNLRFFTREDEQSYAIVYDHPVAGCWMEYVTRYTSGNGYCATLMKDTGLDTRPGHKNVRDPEASAQSLHELFLRERPEGERITITEKNVVELFCWAYADDMAWRKNKGISAVEVAKHIKQRG